MYKENEKQLLIMAECIYVTEILWQKTDLKSPDQSHQNTAASGLNS